jgi:hypothetical protein
MDVIVGAWIALAASLLLGFRLINADRRQSHPTGSFGREQTAASANERHLLIIAYATQQRWSFVLVFAAVAIGIVLAATVVTRAIMMDRLDPKTLSSVAGIAADLWLGRRAWQLYQTASKRLESIALST